MNTGLRILVIQNAPTKALPISQVLPGSGEENSLKPELGKLLGADASKSLLENTSEHE